MSKVIKEIDLGCLPLNVLGKDYMNVDDMRMIITDYKNGEVYFEEPFEDLEVVIKEGARLMKKEFIVKIPKAENIAGIVIPVAKALMKNVFNSEENMEKHGAFRYPEDLVFEDITIYDNGKVDIFFGS